jgi:hypothetical protein
VPDSFTAHDVFSHHATKLLQFYSIVSPQIEEGQRGALDGVGIIGSIYLIMLNGAYKKSVVLFQGVF